MSLNWALEIRSVPSSINVILFPFPMVIWCPSFVHVTSSIIALRNFALQANTRLPPGITSASLGSLIVYEQISWLSSDAAWPYDFGLPEKNSISCVKKGFSLQEKLTKENRSSTFHEMRSIACKIAGIKWSARFDLIISIIGSLSNDHVDK